MPSTFSSNEVNYASLLETAEVLVKSKVDVSGAGLKDYYFGEYSFTERIIVIKYDIRAFSV